MSKSKKNAVDPGEIINLYGADTARWFMLSDSPPERDLEWTETGVVASYKFINKIWDLFENSNTYKTDLQNTKKTQKKYQKSLFLLQLSFRFQDIRIIANPLHLLEM